MRSYVALKSLLAYNLCDLLLFYDIEAALIGNGNLTAMETYLQK